MVIAILYAVYTDVTDSPLLHLLAYPCGAVAIHTVGDTNQQPQNTFHNSQRDTNHAVSQEKCVGITKLRKAHNN